MGRRRLSSRLAQVRLIVLTAHLPNEGQDPSSPGREGRNSRFRRTPVNWGGARFRLLERYQCFGIDGPPGRAATAVHATEEDCARFARDAVLMTARHMTAEPVPHDDLYAAGCLLQSNRNASWEPVRCSSRLTPEDPVRTRKRCRVLTFASWMYPTRQHVCGQLGHICKRPAALGSPAVTIPDEVGDNS